MAKIAGEMKRIYRYMVRYKNQELEPLGLTFRESEAITFIRIYPNSGQDALAEWMALDKSGVTRIITSMEERGIIYRQTNPLDRREQLLFLTEKGEELAPKVLEINRRWTALITEGMSKNEVKVFTEQLSEMKARAAAYFRGEKEEI